MDSKWSYNQFRVNHETVVGKIPLNPSGTNSLKRRWTRGWHWCAHLQTASCSRRHPLTFRPTIASPFLIPNFVFEGKGIFCWEGECIFSLWVLVFVAPVKIIVTDKIPVIGDGDIFGLLSAATNTACIKETRGQTKQHMLSPQPVTQNAHVCIWCLLIFFLPFTSFFWRRSSSLLLCPTVYNVYKSGTWTKWNV